MAKTSGQSIAGPEGDQDQRLNDLVASGSAVSGRLRLLAETVERFSDELSMVHPEDRVAKIAIHLAVISSDLRRSADEGFGCITDMLREVSAYRRSTAYQRLASSSSPLSSFSSTQSLRPTGAASPPA